MRRIRILPEEVANQIAAGEVVERPASVVKELVENALDAGAKHIKVEIQAGGRALIRVTDDGCGMSREDALLAFERHATSKISTIHDLQRITSFGFRGEALPSIASVSQLTLVTRPSDPAVHEGTRVIIHGGKIINVTTAGTPPGTIVEVRNLFYNVPARRKFLRSDETEAANIEHYLTTVALAFPEIAFTLVKDGRIILQFPPIPTLHSRTIQLEALAERLRTILPGIQLIPVDSETLKDVLPGLLGWDEARVDMSLIGYVGAPGVTRSTRADQYIYVNRRPIENRALSAAIEAGYHTLLMKGRRPICCLFLEIEPTEVDVNVHPTKREVKFRHESHVRAFVTEVIRFTLARAHKPITPSSPTISKSLSNAVLPSHTTNPIDVSKPPLPIPKPSHETGPDTAPKAPSPKSERLLGLGLPNREYQSKLPQAPKSGSSTQPLDYSNQANIIPVPEPQTFISPPSSVSCVRLQTQKDLYPPPVSLLHVPLRYIGVLGNLYVLFESDRGLVLMDQHAAHERVLFERMLSYVETNAVVPSQKLLLPQTIELSTRDSQMLREILPALQKLGISLAEFGPHTFLLDGLPALIKIGDPKQFVLDLIDGVKEATVPLNIRHLGWETLARTVCRHAVKAHDPLSHEEILALLEQLRHCQMPYTCPHGRPTLIELSYREIEKKFGRVT